MAAVVRVSGQYVGFHCPGCDDYHQVDTTKWEWNGMEDMPTFEPSVLVTYHDDRRCHSFIRLGVAMFLADCTHALAGENVALPEWTGFS